MINDLLASFSKRQSWMLCLLAGVTILLAVACTAGPTLPSASPIPASDVGPPATLMPEVSDPTETPPVQPRFAISADRGWDTLGMFVRPGQQFEISAAGSWSHGAEETPYGPGGSAAFDPDSILPSAPIGALIGRIGNNPPFEVGESAILTAGFGGELSLSINEPLHALSDNTGSLEVSVSLGPLPANPAQLLTNYDGEYILLYPAGYHVVIYAGGMCLTQVETSMMVCHVANAFIEVGEAGGRTLDQVADEIASQANPDSEVRRASLMVSGVEAVLLDDIYSYDVLRKVVVVHRDRTYVLTFVPWNDQLEDFPRMENLYDTIIRSFAFLPQLETPPLVETEPESHISAVSPVTVYSGPGRQYPAVGVLQAGDAARVIGWQDGDYWPDHWMEIACPNGMAGGCWVLWDMNSLYSYEGPPVVLDIPDPAGLAVVSSRTHASPDGRWQVKTTESEAVSVGPEEARFFFVEFTVTSLVDGTTWTPVSEWHAYGLGLETAPQPFHWSQDGRYLYYTSLVVPDGGCGFYANSGESLDRLDLSDGSVSVLQPPYNRWMLAISPDEARMAYLSSVEGYQLIVRDLEGAYSAGPSSLDSIQWQIPLDLNVPRVVSEIGWSPDGQKVLLMVADIASNCQPAQATQWELDIASGAFVEGTKMFFPTATP